jgi:hypothetical protein
MEGMSLELLRESCARDFVPDTEGASDGSWTHWQRWKEAKCRARGIANCARFMLAVRWLLVYTATEIETGMEIPNSKMDFKILL